MKSGKVPQLNIGIQLASLRLPFKKALHTAAQLGAEGVEIDARGAIRPDELSRTGVRQLRKLLADLNLRVSAVGFRTRRGYNVTDRLEPRIAATKQAMQLAYQLGAPVVVNQVGRVPQQSEGPPWDLLLEALGDLGRFGHHVGAVLAAETGSEEPENLARLISALSSGSIGVDLNPGRLIINGFSPRDAVDLLGAHVLHVHAKDGAWDAAKGRGVEALLGRGSAEFPELIGALEHHQYRGFFTIERDDAGDPVSEISQAVSYLKSL